MNDNNIFSRSFLFCVALFAMKQARAMKEEAVESKDIGKMLEAARAGIEADAMASFCNELAVEQTSDPNTVLS